MKKKIILINQAENNIKYLYVPFVYVEIVTHLSPQLFLAPRSVCQCPVISWSRLHAKSGIGQSLFYPINAIAQQLCAQLHLMTTGGLHLNRCSELPWIC